jgi:rubrerythrin
MRDSGLSDVVNAALELEQKGYDHYIQVSDKTQNPLTKRLFSVLAEQELDHMKKIRELFETDTSETTEETIPGVELEQVVKELFDEFTKDNRSNWLLDVSSAYEHAMKLEEESIEMYAKFADESKNETETSFFKSLVEEERGHLTALENAYHYLNQTSGWFESTESQTWNWMNT